jgi:glyoxylase-like metal-dependent hydrolase (beta-lactamase superfamily II)
MLTTHVIDAEYLGLKGLSAVYLMRAKNGECALVDCGTPARYDTITEHLASHGVARDDLTSILLTHTHLDHAGNLSLFTRHHPHIKIYLHPVAFEQLNDLDAHCRRMEGRIGRRWITEFRNQVVPIPARHFVLKKDCDKIHFGGSTIKCIHTPGHTHDHLCFHEPSTKTLFTGDAFGILYPIIEPPGVIFAATSEFRPEGVYATIDRIKRISDLERVALSHYGYVRDVGKHADNCRRFVSELWRIGTESQSLHKAVEKLYDGIFGAEAMQKWRRLRANMVLNRIAFEQYFRGERPGYQKSGKIFGP